MKGSGLFILFLIVGTAAFLYLGCRSKENCSSGRAVVSTGHRDETRFTTNSRKLKESSYQGNNIGDVSLEDYRPIDPVPSSKASIRPGPIQHGTPLMPYIPKPAPPPGRPKHGWLP